jgi:hypothetical protein
MLTSYNSGKYLTRTYTRDKNAAEWDKTLFTAAEIEFLDVQDGEGKIKAIAGRMQEEKDGILNIYGCST